MQPYSLDLRERIVKSWQNGDTKAALARVFMVSLSSVKRYINQFEAVGHVEPTIQRRMQGKLTKKLRKKLARQIDAHPDYTLAQHMQLWNSRNKVQVSESCLSRAIRQMGYTRKKKTFGARERDEEARQVFREMMETLDVNDIVVVDESGTRIGMFPLYARSWRGLRVYDQSIRNYGKNITLLASLTVDGIQAAMTVEGAVDEVVFETYLEKMLIPTLRPGQIVMMDNLSSHKTERIAALLEKTHCQLLYLPAYSPDLSPIEEAFSKLKAFIRRCRCKTVAALMKAIKNGLAAITAEDSQGWFAHAGFVV
jgi:transposase